MKQCSWFSILKLISMHDQVWHARKWQAEQVASLVKGAHGKDFVTKFVAGTTDLGVSSSSALGIEALKGQPFLNISPSSGNIEARLMSFLLHLMEARWW